MSEYLVLADQSSRPLDSSDPTGTRAIERSIFLLTTIAGRPHLGWRMTDLAENCGLSKSTTHRILTSLVAHRLLKQRPDDRRYFPGPLLYELALALPAHFAFQAACRPSLTELAKKMNAAVFLAMRSDYFYVCIDKAGKIPLGLVSRMGTRRLLISSGMGNAMLVHLTAEQRAEAVEACIKTAKSANDQNLSAYLRMAKRSRRCGFGLNMGDLGNDFTSVGVAVKNHNGFPFASITAIADSNSMSHQRIFKLRDLLEAESEKISREHQQLIAEIS